MLPEADKGSTGIISKEMPSLDQGKVEILSGEHKEKTHLGVCPIKEYINEHAQFKNITQGLGIQLSDT